MADWRDHVELADLLGTTLISVVDKCDEVIFTTLSGAEYKLLHFQDCCENVRVEEIIGDLDDLVGSPILRAEEVSNAEGPEPEYPDSYTWTFYKFATIKGEVVIRWLGESNGYYSESVDFVRTKEGTPMKQLDLSNLKAEDLDALAERIKQEREDRTNRWPKTIEMYVHGDKDQAHEKSDELGLDPSLRWNPLYEVKFTLRVDENGGSVLTHINDRPIQEIVL